MSLNFLPLISLLALPLCAQFPPGYVDPQPVLDAAAQAIGADRLRSGMVGRQRESGWNIGWPRGEALAHYTRAMNWDAGTVKEEFDRKPGLNPPSWKYGLGSKDGTPLQRNPRRIFYMNHGNGWHLDGPGAPPMPASPGDAERWQLNLWLNPHGFLKAAKLPGANPEAVWRWELGESGHDGRTTVPGLDVQTIAPIHGPAVPWTQFLQALGEKP
ncbi:MAG: hypothetical protein IT167_29890 [Bryobacterales bacterium]|nr:hypothetical protein [Bryobacterales bacterium]